MQVGNYTYMQTEVLMRAKAPTRSFWGLGQGLFSW